MAGKSKSKSPKQTKKDETQQPGGKSPNVGVGKKGKC